VSFDPEAVRDFEHAGWQRAAASYSATFARATSGFIASLLDAARVGSGSRVLDLACGPGLVAAVARQRGAVAIGLDFSAAMIALARAEIPVSGFEEGDAEALPLADGSFDTVVSNFGIHHVPDAVRALSEACRVLRRGGRIGFTSWAVPAANIAWKILFDAISAHGDLEAAKAPPSGGGLRTPEDFLRAMSAAGFAESRAGRGTALRFGSQSARRVWPRDRAHRGADRCPASPAIAGDRSRDRTSPRPLPASRRFCGADRRDPGFGRASLRAVRNRPSKRCVGRNNASHRACGKTAVYADRPVRRFIMTMDVGDPAETQQQADNEVPLEQVYGG